MSLRTKIKDLFVPRKVQSPVAQPGYGTDMRAIEMWAHQVLDYINANGIIEITSTGATVTITNPFGPVTNLETAGGSGVTDVVSPLGSITVTNPTGPTVDVDVTNYPFLNGTAFTDANQNVGYGAHNMHDLSSSAGPFNSAFGNGALGTITSTSSARDNTGIGYQALAVMTTGSDNTAVGYGSQSTVTTGAFNTSVGSGAGLNLTTGSYNTHVGASAQSDAAQNYNTALGANTTCAAGIAGAVALGTDNTNTGAAASHTNDLALGTAIHVIVLSNNHTGANTMDLGTNSPATGPHPHSWIKIRDAAGTIGYIPYWV